jgi:hypothetical protein
LISDYRLAGAETGLDGIARMRRALGESIPAMLVSGENCATMARGASRAGVGLLRKPIRTDALRRYIGEICGRLFAPA